MVGIVSGVHNPTRPPHTGPFKCMVKGCIYDIDPGSTQHLCRMCYDLITTGDMLKYYANYTGKNWMSDTVTQIAHLKQDKRDLQDEVDGLKMDIKEAYILENGDTLSLNDLRTFYHEHKKDVEHLRQEIDALNYNMDHAYTLGDGKFLTLDDLCIFYQENKNIHNVVQQQHNRILLLGLELKQLQKPKDETFATNTEDKFAERAKINEEKQNVKFEGYTEGFWKGFDLGYSKARDQFYE